jgi:epimerase transport system membrane fusion protein
MMQKLAKIPTTQMSAAMVGDANPPALNNVIKLDTNDRSYQIMGSVIIIGVFGVFAVWSALAPLGSASVASGRVVVDMKKQVVQHREGGVIQDILVEDGDYVQKGQKLLVINPVDAQSDQSSLSDQLLGYVGLEARLNAELEGQKKLIFPLELLNNSQSQVRAREIMTDELQQFKVRQSGAASEDIILRQKMAQIREQIQGVENQIQSERALEASYAKEAQQLQDLFDRKLISNLQLNEADRNRLATAAKVSQLESSKVELKVQGNQAEEQLLLQQNQRNKETAAQLGEVRLKVTDLRNRLGAVDERLERTVVVAPEAGTVVDLAFHTKGGVVESGARILDIVPKIDSFEIEASVSISDIDKVRAGQEADIRFPAFTSSSFLKVTPGQVKLVSADTLIDPNSHQPYYQARVVIKPEGVKELSKHDLELVQGMPAEVSIKTGERTFLQYLLKPVRNMWNHAFNED